MKNLLCRPLLAKELRANGKLAALFAGVLTLYSIIIIGMFDPALGESLEQMAQSMPQLFAAFGMANAGTTLLDFMLNYLYGFLFQVFPLVLTLLLVHRLLVRYADRGSLAWLLAQPVPRRTLACTQIAALGLYQLVLTAYLTVLCVGAAGAMFPGELDVRALLAVNVGLVGLHLMLAGVCWLGACAFAGGRLALGSGGGLCVLFLLVQMLSQVGEQTEWLRYLTPLTLFDPAAIAAGQAGALWQAAAMYAVAAALFGAGTAVFTRRDLSL